MDPPYRRPRICSVRSCSRCTAMTGRALPARLPIPRAWSSPSLRNDSTPPCASPTRLTRPVGGACVSSPTLNSHTNAGRYLFAATDGHSEWSGWQIHCLASEDLTHWQDRGVVIDLHDQHLDGSGRTNILPGRTAHAWVPALAVRDGRYYLYFCGDGQTNVAVSDHIDGGYALQGDLARTGSHAARHGFGTGIVAPGIDPAAFRDPQTGRWYLAWGRTGRATPACPTTCCTSSPKPRPTSGRPHI